MRPATANSCVLNEHTKQNINDMNLINAKRNVDHNQVKSKLGLLHWITAVSCGEFLENEQTYDLGI